MFQSLNSVDGEKLIFILLEISPYYDNFLGGEELEGIMNNV